MKLFDGKLESITIQVEGSTHDMLSFIRSFGIELIFNKVRYGDIVPMSSLAQSASGYFFTLGWDVKHTDDFRMNIVQLDRMEVLGPLGLTINALLHGSGIGWRSWERRKLESPVDKQLTVE